MVRSPFEPILALLAVLLSLFQCPPQRMPLTNGPYQGIAWHFAPANDPSIALDGSEGFFERAGALDMSLQLQHNFPEGTPRDSIVARYRQHLVAGVMDFSTEEQQFVNACFRDIQDRLVKAWGGLDGFDIKLIKTNANHYGPSVYYTRDMAIVIPQNALEEANREAFTRIMWHELFHIYSRYRPEMRQALYKRIGYDLRFEPGDLDLGPYRELVLLNPDGLEDYAIALGDDKGTATYHIPLLFSKSPRYEAEFGNFFGHLDFKLVPLRQTAQGQWQVDGDKPLLNPYDSKALFEKIGPNTFYIIHPDEVLADNFIILMTGKSDEGSIAELPEAGQQLLRDMATLMDLQNF